MYKAIFIITFLCLVSFTGAEGQKRSSKPSIDPMEAVNLKYQLFDNDDIFHFKLTGRLSNLFNDRNKNISYHPMLLQYKNDTGIVSIRLTVKTRGNFRRILANCKMPPLMLNFPKTDKMKGLAFENQKKLKLVVPCQGDEYVIREWLVYKLYNLLTEKSFKAKLVQVDFEDSLSRRATESHYCILLEDETKLAERNKSFVWNRKMRSMQSVEKSEFLKMAVFQYMIGNTDWSVPYLQNIKMITKDSTKAPAAVPYDFDHAAIVDAPYSAPAPELEINSTHDRLYRGYCEKDKKIFAETFELFNNLKDSFYKIYTDCPLLGSRYIKSTTKFLNDFYKVINSDKLIKEEFDKPCQTNVRVELKGLRE